MVCCGSCNYADWYSRVSVLYSIIIIYILDLVNIFPPKGSPYGLTYEEHIKNYWKFIISIPANQNPVNDETGEKSVTSQINSSSSVFYLADSRRGKTERTCTIPSGKGVLIPVMVVEFLTKRDQTRL